MTVRDFEERLASQPPQIRAQYSTSAAREKLLDDMVRLELLAQEAKRRGFDRSPRLKVLVSELLVEEMMNSLFGSEESEAAKVTDEEIRRYYDAHSAEFSSPEERRAMDIVLGDRQSAEAVLRQLAAHPDEALFGKAASEKSQDPDGRARAGDLGFFSATSASRPADTVRRAVFQLRHPGDMTGVVPSDGGFHVLMLTGVRPGIVRSLADAQSLIRARLAQEKRREATARFTGDLAARAHVQLHRDLLPKASGSL